MTSRQLGGGTLVIATHNSGKLTEIGALLAPYGMNCISAGSLGLPEPPETGKTFAENALIKARAAAESSGIPALADDSGLCVTALDNMPGVYTADWAQRQWFEGKPGRDWYMAMGKVEGRLCSRGLMWTGRAGSLARSPSPGRTANMQHMKAGSMAHFAGRRAALWALAMIRYSCHLAIRGLLPSLIRQKSTPSATVPLPLRNW